jgi:hypothetical protein
VSEIGVLIRVRESNRHCRILVIAEFLCRDRLSWRPLSRPLGISPNWPLADVVFDSPMCAFLVAIGGKADMAKASAASPRLPHRKSSIRLVT